MNKIYLKNKTVTLKPQHKKIFNFDFINSYYEILSSFEEISFDIIQTIIKHDGLFISSEYVNFGNLNELELFFETGELSRKNFNPFFAPNFDFSKASSPDELCNLLETNLSPIFNVDKLNGIKEDFKLTLFFEAICYSIRDKLDFQNKLFTKINPRYKQCIRIIRLANNPANKDYIPFSPELFNAGEFKLINNIGENIFSKISPEVYFIKHICEENLIGSKFHEYLISKTGLSNLEALNINQSKFDEYLADFKCKGESTYISKFNFLERRKLLSFNLDNNNSRSNTLQFKLSLSIVIPVVDHYYFTNTLIEEIASQCINNNIDFEVIVVSNGSVDETKTLKKRKNTILIEYKEKLGFSKACNMGAQRAKNDILLFLNNDIELLQFAVANSLFHFENKDNIAVVGAKILQPNFLIQEVGCSITEFNTIGNFRNEYFDHSESLSSREVDFVSACYLMTKRQSFHEIGGFNEVYGQGYFEDTEFCLSAKKLGKIICEPHSIAVHYEYATQSGNEKNLHKKLMDENRTLFFIRNFQSHTRWANNKKNLLIIDDQLPNPAIGQGFTRAFDLVYQASKSFSKVYFLPTNFIDERQEKDILTKIQNFTIFKDIDEFVAKTNSIKFDQVLISRNHNIQNFLQISNKLILNGERPLITLDTEALEWDRESRFKRLHKVPSPSLFREIKPKVVSEIESHIVVNIADYNSLRNMGCPNIKEYGHYFDKIENSFTPNRHKIIIECGVVSTKSPNYDALSWFINKVLSKIIETDKIIELDIYGYNSASLEPLFKNSKPQFNKNFNFLGEYVALSEVAKKGGIYLAPTRYSAGMPMKVHNALRNGFPCIISSQLFEQLGFKKTQNMCLEFEDNNAQDCFKKIMSILNNKELQNKYSEQATEYMRKNHSAKNRPNIFI